MAFGIIPEDIGDQHAPPFDFGGGAGGADRPGTPTLTLAVAGSTVTATINGDDGVLNYLVYWKAGDVAWSDGGNRSGDGVIEVNGLTADVTYIFCAYSELVGVASLISIPATTAIVTAASGDVTPTGQFGKAAANLRDLIAASATFQAAVAAGDAESAKAYIHIAEYKPDDAAFDRPYALITPPDNRSSLIGVGAFGYEGILELWLEQDIPSNYQANDQADNAETWFWNFVDGCVADCQALSSQPGYLVTSRWSVGDGPYRYDKKNIYGIKMDVAWGLSQ